MSWVNTPCGHTTALKSEFPGMEFSEKLQYLRKQRGITQEELAAALYVSRTAVSKWESGRGWPNIDSLKAIGAFFGVTVDELLSEGELRTQPEEVPPKGHPELLFGLLDCCAILLLFLPLFAQKADGGVRAVSLLALSGTAPYLKAACLVAAVGMCALGVLTLALQNCDFGFWKRSKRYFSFGLNGAGALLFTAGLQPYAATFMFGMILIKALYWMKKR